MLAPAGVRYVVVLTSLAPEITGEQSPQQYPVPADLAPALGRQLDLDPVVSGTGITVYANAAWIPQRAEVATAPASPRPPPPGTAATTAPHRNHDGHHHPGRRHHRPNHRRASTAPVSPPGTPLVAGARPVLPGPAAARSYQGPLSRGTVFTALAPAGRWTLIGSDGTAAARSPSFGWAATYRVTDGRDHGHAALRRRAGHPAGAALLGRLCLVAVAGRRRRRVASGGGSGRGRAPAAGRTRVHRDDTGDSPAPDGAALPVGAGEVR